MAWLGLIQQATDELLDRVQDQDYLDACAGFAFLLPAYVLSDLLGIPMEDRDKVVQWSVDFVDFFNVIPITFETTHRMMQSALEMIDYTRNLLAERHTDPRDDFLSTLIAAKEKGSFTEDEIVGMHCSSCWLGAWQ